ncbi:MAG: T9SS C-terminal target domain-containing protein, partial [Bacteroidetes bacterium]
SVHNHQLLLFRSEPNDLSSWSYTVLDSLQRLGTVKNSGGSNQFRETFDFMDMINPNDSVLHLVYGVSDLYGFNDISPKIRRTFFYTRIVIDSLGSSTYTPYHFDFVIPRDGQLRNNFSITSTDDQHIGIAYYDLKNAAVAIKFSADAGQSWSTDTLLEVNIQSPLQTASFGDSLYVLTYDAQKDFQILSSRSRLHAQWQHRPASIQEKRGRAFHSRVQRIEPGRDDIEMVFTEEWRDQLFYGKRTDGNWTYEGVDVAGKKVKEAAMTQNGQGQACAAYVFQATEELKFACKTPGGWQSQLVDGNSKARDIDLAARADSLFLVYFDLATGSLKYARSAGGSQWLVQTLDDSSPIVGLDPKLHIDAQGNKHLAYSDAINQRLKYAFQPPGGAWQLSSITEAFAYQPEQIELLTDSLNRPVLAFRNAFSNQIVLAEQKDGGWQLQVAREGGVSFLGNPFRLLLDAKDRPWIVYNFSDVFDEIRLTRRDAQGSWQDVSIIGNTGRIANSFDFHLVEKDFYIIGKKNARGDQGLAMLYAFEGVTTDLLAPSPGALQAWKLYPNPASSVVNISLELEAATPLHLSLYDLQGRQLAAEALPGLFAPGARQLGWQLPRLQPGMYLLRLQGKGFDAVKKLLIH